MTSGVDDVGVIVGRETLFFFRHVPRFREASCVRVRLGRGIFPLRYIAVHSIYSII